MGTILGIVLGVAFATPITALANSLINNATAKLSDPELLDGVITAVANKTAEIAPTIINKTVDEAPRLIDMLFG
jgi:hypothetical protein